MTTLKEMLDKKDPIFTEVSASKISFAVGKSLSYSQNLISTSVCRLEPAFVIDFSSKKTKEFNAQVGSLIADKVFISELSEKISMPKDNESEDEFVERAKSIMRDLIRKKLSGQ